MNLGPIELDVTPMALLGAGSSEQRRLQRSVGHLRQQRPAQPGPGTWRSDGGLALFADDFEHLLVAMWLPFLSATLVRTVQLFDLVVGVRGFEPPAPASRKQCSTRLSYTPPTARAIVQKRVPRQYRRSWPLPQLSVFISIRVNPSDADNPNALRRTKLHPIWSNYAAISIFEYGSMLSCQRSVAEFRYQSAAGAVSVVEIPLPDDLTKSH